MTGSDEAPGGLRALGLRPAEEAAYEILLTQQDRGPAEFAACWPRPEDPAAVLDSLRDKGLVRQWDGDPPRYTAVQPDIALEALLLEQEQRLQLARDHAAHLAAAYRQAGEHGAGSFVEVVTGEFAVRRLLDRLQAAAHHEIRSLDRPAGIEATDVGATRPASLVPGVPWRTIYDRTALDQPSALDQITLLVKAGHRVRVLSPLPMKLLLVDDLYGVIPLQRDPSAARSMVVVRPCGLLDALHTLFEALWQRSLPLDLPADRASGNPPGAPAGDQQLVALLLGGLTDEAIARQLGLGYRTVQRRVASLMSRLGVRTRFQAGVQVALRGDHYDTEGRAEDAPPA